MTQRHLQDHGIKTTKPVHWNLSVPELIEAAVGRGEGLLTRTGALNARTGKRTGRSPNDKYIVDEPTIHDDIWWGKVNKPLPEAAYLKLRKAALTHLAKRELFVVDAHAGADPRYQMPIRVITELAWHALFIKQLFLRPSADQLAKHVPEWTVINAGLFQPDPAKYGLASDAGIVVDFARRTILVTGSLYAGEMKKGVFSVLNYVLPRRGVLSMHCSANVGKGGDVAIFFGLSGTGKTTLSADPNRGLIGDDEHGWSDQGVFNFEGGCYAKCIKLTKEREPLIWDAIRFGSVVENVVVNPVTREPDYFDDSITENTRCAYPLDFIANAIEGGQGGHPRAIIFLACDAFGVFPPVARLNPEQAMYHFMSGYTAKVAGTEAGAAKDPAPTFSTCFGAPFLPLPPQVYAEMLAERMRRHHVPCYLLNTGWVGEPFGRGPRIPLWINRHNVAHVLEGMLDRAEFRVDPVFGFEVPKALPEMPPELLDPQKSAKDGRDYQRRARDLAAKFGKNFEQYTDAPQGVAEAGPRVR